MKAIVESVLILSVFFVVFRLLMRPGKGQAALDRNGNRVLAFGIGLRIAALVIGLMLGPIFSFFSLTRPPADGTDRFFVSFTAVFAFGFGIAVIAGMFGGRVVLSKEGISKTNVWFSKRSLSWSEVRRVSYSEKHRWIVFEGPSGRNIEVSIMMRGTSTLRDEIVSRFPERTYEPAVKGLSLIA